MNLVTLEIFFSKIRCGIEFFLKENSLFEKGKSSSQYSGQGGLFYYLLFPSFPITSSYK